MGISEGVFWEMNITKLRPYLLAENIKRENENFMLWLNNLYAHSAVSVAIANAFKAKGSKKYEYIKEPIRITPLTVEEKEKEKQKAMAKLKSYLNQFEKRKIDEERR